MSRTYERFCELLSAYNETDEKWTPIQKANELLNSVNEDEIWEQRKAAINALYNYIAELDLELGNKSIRTLREVILERENDLLQEKVSDLLKRVAELEEQLKEAVQYEVLAKVRAGEGTWTPLPNKRWWYYAGCPKCGSMNITTAGVCANCGWS